MRVHGETGKQPIEMFAEEKDSLLPLSLTFYKVSPFKVVFFTDVSH
jgi:hypothetical protein